MTANRPHALDTRRLRWLSRILPVRASDRLRGIDRLGMALLQPGSVEIASPTFALPELTGDLCPQQPEAPAASGVLEAPAQEDLTPAVKTEPGSVELSVLWSVIVAGMRDVEVRDQSSWLDQGALEPGIADLTEWFLAQLAKPRITSIDLSLTKVRAVGKSYRQGAEVPQPRLFEEREGDVRCVHGLKKRFCEVCRQKQASEKARRQKSVPAIDLFDLILPILQPPLDEALENPVAFPPGKRLYPFQRDGVRFLAGHEAALLADEMGLGKSIQAIVAMRLLFQERTVRSALILCPKSVLTDWERKLWEWAPGLRVMTVRGSREEREVQWGSPAHVYVVTYETYRQDLPASVNKDDQLSFLAKWEEQGQDRARKDFDLAILDEIQKVKNPGAGVTKAARSIRARMRWGLSGTPLENRIEELISVFAFLKPGLLQYSHADWPARVQQLIRPYLLRRRKADVLPDLPEKIPDDVWLELSDAQRLAYDRVESGRVSDLRARGRSVTVQHVLALINELKQICNMEPVTEDSCKLDYLLERLEGVVEEGSKALVFSQYPNKTLARLEERLEPFRPLFYHGSLSERQRDRVIQAFQDDEENKVLLISVRAGGQGLTLTRANYVYHFDMWWNPAVAAQAEDRAHRIGQQKNVFVSYLYTIDTIEERIHRLLLRKRQLFDEVVDELSETNLTQALTEEELFGLFNLEPPERSTGRGSGGGGSASRFEKMSPQEFEALVADLYEVMGYHTRLTAATRDAGVDVYAQRQSAAGTEYLAIQCKHYVHGRVGVEHARALYGAIEAQHRIHKGVLVTSGGFSRECQDFAARVRLELVDGARLTGLVERFGVRRG